MYICQSVWHLEVALKKLKFSIWESDLFGGTLLKMFAVFVFGGMVWQDCLLKFTNTCTLWFICLTL